MKGELQYQACQDESCGAPQTVPFEIPIEVVDQTPAIESIQTEPLYAPIRSTRRERLCCEHSAISRLSRSYLRPPQVDLKQAKVPRSSPSIFPVHGCSRTRLCFASAWDSTSDQFLRARYTWSQGGNVMLRTLALGWASLIWIGFAYAVAAEPVRYVLETPGVV